jgi:c-di-GMP-binding flagellar brake protein YcgR
MFSPVSQSPGAVRTMNNRRADYRHCFEQTVRIPVRLDSIWRPAQIKGAVRDLSLGGMSISLSETRVPLAVFQQCFAEIHVEEDKPALRLSAAIVRVDSGHGGVLRCGLQFLSSPEPAQNEIRQKRLWQYLLQQQRLVLNRERSRVAPPAILPRIYVPQDG